MNRRLLLWVTFSLALVLGGFFWLFNQPNQSVYSWRTSFQTRGNQPYDLGLLFELLPRYGGGREVILLQDSLSLPKSDPEAANYVLIGSRMYLDSTAMLEILHFAASGGTVFLALREFPTPLLEQIDDYSCNPTPLSKLEYTVDSVAMVRTLSGRRTHRFVFYQGNGPRPYDWRYFLSTSDCPDSPVQPLGKLATGEINYVTIPFERGRFLLYTHPLLLTNFFLRQAAGKAYLENIFSHLNTGSIYWDDFSRLAINSDPPDTSRRLSSNHAMQYLLDQAAFAWAWYLLLALVLCYVLFVGKRRQRIIPVITPRRNSSKEYVSTISRLYYLRGDHRRLALQEIQLFRQFLTQEMGINWSGTASELAIALDQHSNASAELIETITEQITHIQDATAISPDTLVALHQHLFQLHQTLRKQS